MFAKYAKAIAAALATVVATAVVAWTGGDPASIETLQVALAGGLSTLFVAFGPANSA